MKRRRKFEIDEWVLRYKKMICFSYPILLGKWFLIEFFDFCQVCNQSIIKNLYHCLHNVSITCVITPVQAETYMTLGHSLCHCQVLAQKLHENHRKSTLPYIAFVNNTTLFLYTYFIIFKSDKLINSKLFQFNFECD